MGDVIRVAGERRDEIQAVRARVRAGEARPAIVSALADPMISPSLDHLPFMLGGADVSVTIEQQIPLSGIRGHRRTAALADVDRLRAETHRAGLDVAVEAANAGDIERARWAEDELRQHHRIPKQAYLLDMDVPAPTLKAEKNIPEANELYRRAMTYKDKGWGNDYIDNQRRAELLLQQLLTSYPQSSKIGDAAYQLGDLYEGKAYKQYRRAAMYFERSFQWHPNTHLDGRMRAARLYDKQLMERPKAAELYKEVTLHETDPKRLQEAQKRLGELTSMTNR